MKIATKICVVITARPSYSRIKTVLAAIQSNENLELKIIATSSFIATKFGSASEMLFKDGFKIDWEINTLLEADNLTTSVKTTAIQLGELSTAFYNISPDIVVTIADRYETISTAIAASYMNIPLVHILGGEVTGNIDEKVRHAISKLSDIHFVSNDDCKKRLLKMGETPQSIFVTGCPSIDVAYNVLKKSKIENTFDPVMKYGGVGDVFDINQSFVVMMQHPVTTHFENSRKELNETLYALFDINIPVFCFWPNPDMGTESAAEAIRTFREIEKPKKFHFFKNLNPEDFLLLLLKSKCLIGNSSVGIRECSYLGVPVVNIGKRQNGRLRGNNVIDVETNKDQIKKAIQLQIEKGIYKQEFIYGEGNAGIKIAEYLAYIQPTIEKKITY